MNNIIIKGHHTYLEHAKYINIYFNARKSTERYMYSRLCRYVKRETTATENDLYDVLDTIQKIIKNKSLSFDIVIDFTHTKTYDCDFTRRNKYAQSMFFNVDYIDEYCAALLTNIFYFHDVEQVIETRRNKFTELKKNLTQCV